LTGCDVIASSGVGGGGEGTEELEGNRHRAARHCHRSRSRHSGRDYRHAR